MSTGHIDKTEIYIKRMENAVINANREMTKLREENATLKNKVIQLEKQLRETPNYNAQSNRLSYILYSIIFV